jgi:hypothetical protein
MFPSPSHSTSPKEMDVTVPDIPALLPHVKHADVFLLIPAPRRNRNRCGGPNPEKCRGSWRSWPSRSPRDMCVSVAACSARRGRRGIHWAESTMQMSEWSPTALQPWSLWYLRRNPPKHVLLRQGFGGHPLRIPPRLDSRGFLRRRVKDVIPIRTCRLGQTH